MEVLVLQVFVSLVLVVSSLLLFAYSMRRRDHEHADRLALLPIEEEQIAFDHAAATADVPPNLQGRKSVAGRDELKPLTTEHSK